jgi:ribosomal protein S18 acetylase RimI-like enzyme
MIIRRLNASDAKAYQELRLKALKNHPEAYGSSFEEESEFSIEVFEQRLSNPDNITWGAYVDEHLAGVVTLLTSSRKKTMHNGSIVAMYVDDLYRRHGIGSYLLKHAIIEAKTKSIVNLYLTVTTTNLVAKKLYSSFGFVTYGIEKNGLKIDQQYFDSELMVLYL